MKGRQDYPCSEDACFYRRVRTAWTRVSPNSVYGAPVRVPVSHRVGPALPESDLDLRRLEGVKHRLCVVCETISDSNLMLGYDGTTTQTMLSRTNVLVSARDLDRLSESGASR